MAEPAESRLSSAPPLSRTRLIGREAERAAARDFLLDGAVPLLTLTGPGGVGKTRLALAIAGEVAANFAEGVVWIDLAPVNDPNLVPVTVAASLALPLADDQPVARQLARLLRPRQTLLLLDNCEHLLAETADLVALLLDGCPALQVVATSRAPLHLRGEHLLPIEPLPLPAADAPLEEIAEADAVRLFTARARAVRPRFQVETANADIVALLCHHLDGLPLAIELAAAHCAVLSPAALLAQMTNRLRLLQGGARDLPSRQQTMRDTIAWSYDRLTAEEQTAFVHLAVFAGGWTLEAAEAVLARDAETTWRLVSQLVAQSLVRSSATEDSPRFTMLETVRAFGMERLAAGGELETVRRRHADYFLDFAEVVANPMVDLLDLETAPACLDLEKDNLREALVWAYECGDVTRLLRFAVALRVYWFLRGRLGEGRTWIDRALLAANRGDVPLPLKAAAYLAAAWYARRQGDNDRAEELGQQSLALFREAGDAVNTAEALELLGRAAEDRGDFRLAQARHQEELHILSSQDKPLRIAMALRNLGWTTYLAGDMADGERGLEEALAACRQLGYDHGAAAVMSDLATAALRGGNPVRAAELLQERLNLTWDAWGLRFTLEQLAEVAAASGEHARAARLFGAAQAFREQIGATLSQRAQAMYEPYMAIARENLGEAGFVAIWEEGRSLSLEDALAEAAHVGKEAAGARSMESLPDPATHHPPPAAMPVGFDLTRREREILALLTQRLTDPEIADRLFLSSRTASKHVGNILGKLGASSRREVAAIAVRHGLV